MRTNRREWMPACQRQRRIASPIWASATSETLTRKRRRASRSRRPKSHHNLLSSSQSRRRSLSAVAADPLADLEVIRVGHGVALLLLHGPTPFAADLPFIASLSRHAELIAPSHP